MKPILLLYPPFEGKTILTSRFPFPLGLLYIQAYLAKHDVKSRVVDFSYPHDRHKTTRPMNLKTKTIFNRYGWTDQQMYSFLKEELPKHNRIVAVHSLMSSNYSGAYHLIDLIKSIDPNRVVVLGGPHATMYPEHVCKNSRADYVCVGEGEESFLDFVNGIMPVNIYPKNYPKPMRPAFVSDLNSLPFIKRSQVPKHREFKEMYLTWSRGCPHSCSFCGSHLIQGHDWRSKSVDRCIKEIKHFMKDWGIKHFIVEDDNPCPPGEGMEFLQDLCKAIIKEKLKIRIHVSHGLPTYFTANMLNCHLLWEAGFRKMTFPLETTDKRVLKDMNKFDTPKLWKRSIDNWKFEKNPPTEIILGYPFVDTIETMLKTIMDVHAAGSLCWASYFRLNKGTPLYERCIRAGYINMYYDPINTQGFYIKTERFSIEDLQELMQITRGYNQLLESKDGWVKSFVAPKKTNQVVAEGSFGFSRSQDIAAAILIVLQTNGAIRGKPIVKKTASRLTYTGTKPSRVWNAFSTMIKER